MLFLALIIIMVMFFLIHTTRVQLVHMLRHGDVDGALRILTMFDKLD